MSGKLISLKHIKEPLASKAPRIAWPGGTIGSNKDEAVARFLEKKRLHGETLSPEQLELLRRFHSAEAAARAERIARGGADDEDEAGQRPVLVAQGHKRRREPIVVKRPGKHATATVVKGTPGVAKLAEPKAKAPSAPAAAKAPPAAPVPSIVDKLSMSLDQLAAMRKSSDAPAPAARKKQRK
jgi:hypothetical protein